MILTQNNNSPNLEIKVSHSNSLKHLGYKSFEERSFDLANLFKNNIDKEFTESIGANVYCSREFEISKHRKSVFEDVYKLSSMKEFIGIIPEENQREIAMKMKTLQENPFISFKFKLVILAPLNNFASENNTQAIDPIAFAAFKKGENCYTRDCLIYLSQWD